MKMNILSMKHHSFIQYVFLPMLLVLSDLFIGFFGHYSGSTGDIFNISNFIEYITDMDNILELITILIIAIIVMFSVEYIVKERLKEK